MRSGNNSSNGNNNNNVGGPLMSVTSHLNGQVGGLNTTSSTSSGGGRSSVANYSASNSEVSTASVGFNHFHAGSMDLEFDLFPSSTLELDGTSGFWTVEGGRSESRTTQVGPPSQQQQQPQQLTQSQQSSSRPASQPNAASNSPSSQANTVVPAHCSPLRAFSPSTSHAFSNSFPFSPLQEPQTANLSSIGVPSALQSSPMDHRSNGSGQESEQHLLPQNNMVSTESGRLRNLLTKGNNATEDSCQESTSAGSSGQVGTEADKPSQTNRILKILLNQQDEDDYNSAEHSGTKSLRNSPGQSVQSKSIQHEHKPNIGPGNNMLLQVWPIRSSTHL
jgi:hypothetical protein